MISLKMKNKEKEEKYSMEKRAEIKNNNLKKYKFYSNKTKIKFQSESCIVSK